MKMAHELILSAVEKALADGYPPPQAYGGPKPAPNPMPNEDTRDAIEKVVSENGWADRRAMKAFLRKVDEKKIKINWKAFTEEAAQERKKRELRLAGEEATRRVIAAERKAEKSLKSLAALRDQLKVAHRDGDAVESLTRIIHELYEQVPKETQPPAWIIKSSKAKTSTGTPVVMLSDIHYGEMVDKKMMAGKNEFNIAIANERLQCFTDRTIDICFNHTGKPEYDGLVLVFGGDMFTGNIHEELEKTNEVPVTMAISMLHEQLRTMIENLADKFGNVYVPCVVGNHGRMNKKPQEKGRVHENYDWLLYKFLQMHFQEHPKYKDRVVIDVRDELDVHFRVHNHRFMLTHGDALGTKGGDGIIGAIGPIKRGFVKLRDAELQIGREFDTLLMGHWHQYLTLPGVIVNGSVKGWDEYARNRLRIGHQPPEQSLFFVHPEHGLNMFCKMNVDPHHRQQGPSAWVSWQSPGPQGSNLNKDTPRSGKRGDKKLAA